MIKISVDGKNTRYRGVTILEDPTMKRLRAFVRIDTRKQLKKMVIWIIEMVWVISNRVQGFITFTGRPMSSCFFSAKNAVEMYVPRVRAASGAPWMKTMLQLHRGIFDNAYSRFRQNFLSNKLAWGKMLYHCASHLLGRCKSTSEVKIRTIMKR